MTEHRKKVLMVSYVFPPDGASSGMLRPLKFSRYLADYGWSSCVLAARKEDYLLRDDSLLASIPHHVKVYRSFAPNSRKYLYFKGKSLGCLSFPDRVLWWWPFAYRNGIKAIRQEQPELLWSTSPMVTTNLIAYSLKRKTGLPWIADFRDPWVHVTDTGWQRRLNDILERKVMHFADAVVVTTEWMKTEILARIPGLPAEKIYVIHNGYDEDDFGNLTPAARSAGSPFVLTYTGLLDATYRNPEPLLTALKQLREEGTLPDQGFRIDFYGCSEYLSGPSCRATIEALGVCDLVRDCGRVSRKQSLQVLLDSDALLLIQDADMTRSAIPAKAFDYLRTGKPILALASAGATCDLMAAFESCRLVRNPGDVAAVKEALRGIFAGDAGGVPCTAGIERYSRKSLTQKLALLMDSLTSHAR